MSARRPSYGSGRARGCWTTIDYARTREQFGRPIGSFQAVKHKLPDCYVTLERARAAAYFAAATLAGDDPRRETAVPTAKRAAGDCQRRVVQDVIQTFGGIGYTWEHDLHLFAKRAKADEAVFGTSRTQRRLLAHRLGLMTDHSRTALWIMAGRRSSDLRCGAK